MLVWAAIGTWLLSENNSDIMQHPNAEESGTIMLAIAVRLMVYGDCNAAWIQKQRLYLLACSWSRSIEGPSQVSRSVLLLITTADILSHTSTCAIDMHGAGCYVPNLSPDQFLWVAPTDSMPSQLVPPIIHPRTERSLNAHMPVYIHKCMWFTWI